MPPKTRPESNRGPLARVRNVPPHVQERIDRTARAVARPAVRRLGRRTVLAAQRTRGAGEAPPRPMTWSKALLVIGIALVFDFLRFIFEMFWLFGPVLVGAAAGVYYGKVVGWIAGVSTGVVEYFTGPMFEIFGIIMAIAIGLLGFGTVVLILLFFNHRIFRANKWALLKLLATFIVDETPLLGSLPALSVFVFSMYYRQIKHEKKEYKAWQAEQARFVEEENARHAAFIAASRREAALAEAP